MNGLIDSSVLVAAIYSEEQHHDACASLLDRRGFWLYSHGINETFSTITGGRLSIRLSPSVASALIENDYLPEFEIVPLAPKEILAALRQAESRGVRGGAVFDYMHLVAARKAKAPRLYTLNIRNFTAIARPGDPEIVHPEKA